MRRDSTKEKAKMRARRHARVRGKVRGSAERPRLSVFRSLKHVALQLIDDESGRTLTSVQTKIDRTRKGAKTALAKEAGKLLARTAKAKGITKVVFDRGGYAYHGRVRAVAEGAREEGLEF